ncbi:hypothetical protein L207DRAFT_582447 [Hyaloscypha variabilis F]|uniref:C2H2-type domain-containing protein n=1 Tax=Hyaloscypha variabilis (strain UAMH 11265 / GT02V1 / F) TaxID=1149755 RepID=A0A2J6RNX9_HYAVF|nr:hypothetical protein L207DRAFT_582447 [Hyaloscypha variabilis F]
MTRPHLESEMQLDPETQGPAKTKSAWSRINKRPIDLLRKAQSWLGHHRRRLPPLRNKKRSKRSKLLPPLTSSSSSSQSGDNNADIKYGIGPIEPDSPEMHAVDAVADDEDEDQDDDTEVLLRTMCEAYSILASVADSQGRTVHDLTGVEVQQAVVEAYCLCKAPSDHGDLVDGGISSSSTVSRASNTAPADSKNQGQGQGPGTKRLRSEDGGDGNGDGDGEGDDSGGRRRKRQPSSVSSRKRGPGPNLLWLCPFYLFDQEVHRQCLRLKLSRIVDVRSHILRRHLQQSHCPRCGHGFPNDPTGTNRSNHILACLAPQSAFHYPGATPEQWAEILAGGRNRANSRAHGNRGRAIHTDEDEWFYIWDILFPGTAHPPSPYVQHSDVVQIMLDSCSIFLEQGPAEAIVNHLLPEDTSPELRVQLHQNISFVINSFVNFVNQREVHARVVSNSQNRSTLLDPPEAQISAYSPPSQSQQSQQPPSLAGSSLATYADSNTLNESGPTLVPQIVQPLLGPELPKLPHSDQSLRPAIQDAWPTVAYTGPHRGLTALQVNPHESGDADAGPEEKLAGLAEEGYTPEALVNPHYAIG